MQYTPMLLNQKSSPFGVLLIACLCVCGGCGSNAGDPAQRGREVATEFLSQLRSGQVDDAWATTSSEFKSFMGRDRLRRFVKEHPALQKPAEFDNFQMVTTSGLNLAEFTFTAESATIRVLLSPGRNAWEVERLHVE